MLRTAFSVPSTATMLVAGLCATSCSLIFESSTGADAGAIADGAPGEFDGPTQGPDAAPFERVMVSVDDGNDDGVLLLGADLFEFNNDDLDLGTQDLGGNFVSETVVALRFQSIEIPKNQPLMRAVLEFVPQETFGGEACLRIAVEQTESAGLPLTTQNPDLVSRALAAFDIASTDWIINDTWVADSEMEQSVSFEAQVQSLVDSSSWESGNSIVIFIANGVSGSEPCSGTRPVHSFESADKAGFPAYRPRLHVR